MTESEKINVEQDFINPELHRKVTERIKALTWEQTPQGIMSWTGSIFRSAKTENGR
jgi:hypothetical protein